MKPWYMVVLTAAIALSIAAPLFGQANDEAEEVDRIGLGRLSEGPSIIGAGIVIGEPTGITAKVWFTETGFGIDAAAAWRLSDDSSFHLQADALFHLALVETQGGRYIVPYVGVGLTNRLSDDPRLGLRVPVGLSLLPFRSMPLEFFAEIAPGVGLWPETDADLEFGLGARFYFPL